MYYLTFQLIQYVYVALANGSECRGLKKLSRYLDI